MKIDQLSIFLENRAGRLAEVTETLAKAKVDIRALSLADTSDFGILRLIVDNFERARTTLREAGFTVGKTAVVAIQVPDSPGGLHTVLSTLRGQGVNVEYMYALVKQSAEGAIIIFRFDRTDQALEILAGAGIGVVGGESLFAT